MPDDRSREGGGGEPSRSRIGPTGQSSHASPNNQEMGIDPSCPPITGVLNWSSPSFTSTVDVDAIKISGAGLGEFKAPLTTIAENWEFSVSERNQKQEQVEDESTSGSETEGSESDSGSNEESSSSSCSSIESDSSSDNNDDLKKDGNIFDERDKVNHQSGSDAGNKRRGRRRSSLQFKGNRSPNVHRTKSPNFSGASPSRSSISPNRSRRRSGAPKAGRSPLIRQLSPLTRRPVTPSQHASPNKDPSKFRTIKDEIHCKIFKISSNLEKRSSKETTTNCDFLPMNASDINSDILKRNEVEASSIPLGSLQPPDHSDSDDSCIILDNVTKPQHLILDPNIPSFQDDTSYSHKKDVIYAAYGRSQSRQQDITYLGDQIKTPDLSELSESSSESSSSSCETSLDESQDVVMDSAPDQGSLNSDVGDLSPPPPTLEPAIPSLSMPSDANTSDKFKSKLSTNEVDNKVECASQTVESGFPYIPNSSKEAQNNKNVTNLVGGSLAPPPILDGIGADPHNISRGRPRKNPPMLKPQNTTNESSEEEEETVEIMKKKKFQKKKDKLSVLFAVAKQLKRKYKNDEVTHEKGSGSEQSCDEADKKLKSKKIREKRRERHLKSHVQRSSKHKRSHKVQRTEKKKNKRRPKSEDSLEAGGSTIETEKVKRHKEKRDRKKTRKDCYECDEFTKSARPSSHGEQFKRSSLGSSKRPSSSQGISRRHPVLDLKRPASTDEHLKHVTSSFSQNLTKSTTSTEEKNFLSIFTENPVKELRNHFASPEPGSQLLFPKKFCNLKPEKFWKKSKRKLLQEEKVETDLVDLGNASQPYSKDHGGSSVFATKASVKELPSSQYAAGNTVQQMLEVLASTSTTKKKKEEKEKGRKKEDKDRKEKYQESQYDTVSEDEESLSSRRRKRGWKSKHKNVVDPVFLGELEHLMQDLACCQLEHKISPDLWPDRPSNSMPSIFKRRKIFTTRRKRDQGKMGKKVKTPRASTGAQEKRSSPTLEVPECGPDEQRLPLKKRHHHLQGAGSEQNSNLEEIEIEIEIGTMSPVKFSQASNYQATKRNLADEYPRPEPALSPRFRLDDKTPRSRGEDKPFTPRKPGDILSPSKLPQGRLQDPNSHKILQNNLIKKPTAADRIVEKLGIQIKKEKAESSAVKDTLQKDSTKENDRNKSTERAEKNEIDQASTVLVSEKDKVYKADIQPKLFSTTNRDTSGRSSSVEESARDGSSSQRTPNSEKHEDEGERLRKDKELQSGRKREEKTDSKEPRFNLSNLCISPGSSRNISVPEVGHSEVSRSRSACSFTSPERKAFVNNSDAKRSRSAKKISPDENRAKSSNKSRYEGNRVKSSSRIGNDGGRITGGTRISPEGSKAKSGSKPAYGSWERWKHSDQPAPSTGSSYVDSIKDCIDKYTFVDDEEEADSPFPTLPRRYLSSGSRKSDPKCSTPIEDKSITTISSPEPEHSSGRDSSLSHTSIELFPVNPETAESPLLVGAKPSSHIGRASRQDLHNHLWREEKLKKSPGVPLSSSSIQNLDANTESFGTNQPSKIAELTLQMSKPLPTEPIRRVDLGFSHKPLDKSLRFHRGQECYIKKVPQAIVAPFRRNPPDNATSLAPSFTPIHRASIATAVVPVPHVPVVVATEPSVVQEIQRTNKEQVSFDGKDDADSSQDNNLSPAKLDQSGVSKDISETTVPLKDEGSKILSKTRSQSSLSEEQDRPVVAVNKRISLTDETSIDRMSKCQVEVCRLKEEVSKEQNCNPETTTKKLELSRKVKSGRKVDMLKATRSSCVESSDQDKTLVIDRPKRNVKENHDIPLKGIEVTNLASKKLIEPEAQISKENEHVSNDEKHNLEMKKNINKKRKRRTNKTGFPTKVRKKKPRLDNSPELNLKEVSLLKKPISSNIEKPSAPETTRSLDKKRRLVQRTKFIRPQRIKEQKEDLDKIASRKSIVNSTKQSKEDSKLMDSDLESSVQSNDAAMDGNENIDCSTEFPLPDSNVYLDSSLCKELETNVEIKLKRSRDISSRSPGRPTKRLRLGQSSRDSSLNRSNASSVDQSPASSDVESSDKYNWDDESDQDSLSVLPPSDDALSCPTPREKKKKKGSLRKTYLKSGLFSLDYKSVVNQGSDTEVVSRLKGMVYKPEEHPFSLLPPPYYCGRQLRQKKEDFNLPFDIWSLYSSKAIPTRDVLATWNYKRIKNNIYYDVKPGENYETPGCHCKIPRTPQTVGCTDDCINRMTYTECDPSCNLGDLCSNTAIQKHNSPAVVERFMTREKGWGIRSKTNIPSGTFIMEYLGEVVTDKEFKRRMHTDYKKDSHHYCLYLGEGMVIDGHRMGGECRFVNHSCKPNCEMQKWSVNGVYRMGLFNIKPLVEEEELTYDYNFSLFNPHEGQPCHCNNQDCRGVIGGKSQRVRTKQTTQKVTKKAEEKKKDVKKTTKMVKLDGNEDFDERKIGIEINENRKTSIPVIIPVKQMSTSQQDFCRIHSVLLPRNLEKIRKLRDKYLLQVKSHSQYKDSSIQSDSIFNSSVTMDNIQISSQNTDLGTSSKSGMPPTIQTQILAATDSHLESKSRSRFVSTIRGENNVQLVTSDSSPSDISQLSKCFREILSSLQSVKDKSGENIIKFLLKLPSKEENPHYYLVISEPLDLETVKTNVDSGIYSTISAFDQDLLLVFQNFFRTYGQLSPIGAAALTLRSEYLKISYSIYKGLSEKLGPALTQYNRRSDSRNHEDEIRCPCKQFKDEGVMIQCESCIAWLHLDCVHPGVDPETLGKYNCHSCSGTRPDLDIPLVPQPEYASATEIYYVSLQREDKLHLTLGMTVYVLRAFKEKKGDNKTQTDKNVTTGLGGIPHKSISPIKGPSKEAATLTSSNYPTYRTVDKSSPTNDMDIFRIERLWKNESGAMFAFGYHYLRPHETFHEPTRRFYDNEVFRIPLYEVLPLDTIWCECWVVDPAAFCKGRPLNAQENYVHICEYRVDKSARLFNKISKPKHGVCTKYYAFHNFDLRLRISRTYVPHDVPERWIKYDKEKRKETAEKKNKDEKKSKKSSVNEKERKKGLLGRVLKSLLLKQGDPDPEDASYLLSHKKPKSTAPRALEHKPATQARKDSEPLRSRRDLSRSAKEPEMSKTNLDGSGRETTNSPLSEMAKESVGSGSESVLSTGQPAGEPDLADGQPEISRSDGVGREPVTSEESKIHRKDK